MNIAALFSITKSFYEIFQERFMHIELAWRLIFFKKNLVFEEDANSVFAHRFFKNWERVQQWKVPY